MDDFTDQQKFGHDIFYGLNDSGLYNRTLLANVGGVLTDVSLDAGYDKCHSNRPCGVIRPPFTVVDNGAEEFQTYTDFGFHNLGVATNHETVTQTSPNLGMEIASGDHCGQFATTAIHTLTKKPNKNFVKA